MRRPCVYVISFNWYYNQLYMSELRLWKVNSRPSTKKAPCWDIFKGLSVCPYQHAHGGQRWTFGVYSPFSVGSGGGTHQPVWQVLLPSCLLRLRLLLFIVCWCLWWVFNPGFMGLPGTHATSSFPPVRNCNCPMRLESKSAIFYNLFDTAS